MRERHPFSRSETPNRAHLRILETTDLHVHVFPYDYYADKPAPIIGLARAAQRINMARSEAENSILVDNGDFLQGNPLGDYIAHEQKLAQGQLHPVIAAMNTLGYDAATLGNHEFNYGLGFLTAALSGANFPLTCANVAMKLGHNARNDRTLLPPYLILDRVITDGAGKSHPIKIGIIGVLPPQIMTWDRQHLDGNVQTRDIVETARALVPQMKEAGADVIVALCHSGIAGARDLPGLENAAVPLAGVAGIDALVTGHSHLVFPSPAFRNMAGVDVEKGTLMGKPAVMAGFWGSHIGIIDLLLERDGQTWRVLDSTSDARQVRVRRETPAEALKRCDTGVMAAVEPAHEATLKYVRRPVGTTPAALHSFFPFLGQTSSLQIICAAQDWYLKNLFKGGPFEGRALLSAAAPFRAGGRGGPDYFTYVKAGPVAVRNLADLYFYPNLLRVVDVSGAELEAWLERAAGAFAQIIPGQTDQPLLDPDFPSYNFDVISGITYEIDPSQPARFNIAGDVVAPNARRIRNLRFQGQTVDPAARFLVATNSYRAGGGGRFPGALGDSVVLEAPDTIRDILLLHFKAQSDGSVTLPPEWPTSFSLTRLAGTAAQFETAPQAKAYLDQLSDFAPENMGLDRDGFLKIRVDLSGQSPLKHGASKSACSEHTG